MNTLHKVRLIDYAVILTSLLFIFGCIASSYRTAKTVEPGRASLSGGYMHAINLDNSDADPIDLLDLNARFGLLRGFDAGIAHTFDLTSKNEGKFASIWGDFKVQLSNRDNIIGEPIFSLGLLKGYVYDPEAKLHITTLPLMLSIPSSDYVTPTLQYRLEFISDDILPTSFEDPRHTFTLGTEFNLTKPDPDSWTPKIGVAIGIFNSLIGGDGDSGLILNLGFILDSPFSY